MTDINQLIPEGGVLQAALKINGEIITKPRPARHGDLIKLAPRSHVVQPEEQGFIDTNHEWLSREEAAIRAHDMNQIADQPYHLFTEDLW